jgi:hypothetical protein
MPKGGLVGLPRDWITAQQAAADKITKRGGVQCRHGDGSCNEQATRTCYECGNVGKKVYLCEVHSQQHEEGKHTMKPIDVAAAATADIAVPCPTDPGAWNIALLQ